MYNSLSRFRNLLKSMFNDYIDMYIDYIDMFIYVYYYLKYVNKYLVKICLAVIYNICKLYNVTSDF